jgi:hypothetical protein
VKEKGPLKLGRNHLEENLHGDERKHDSWKRVEIHLRTLLKEVIGEILVDHE